MRKSRTVPEVQSIRIILILGIVLTVITLGSAKATSHKKVIEGRTGSTSRWFNKNPNDIPKSNEKGRGANKESNETIFKVRMVTTNTRAGAIDVKTLENRTYGIFVGKDPPDNVYHAAVSVHGFMFEFIFDKGIDATDEKKYLEETEPLWIDSEFETERTPKEVKAWLLFQLGVFNQGTYNMVDHNCFHFAKALCEFLGGEEPKKNAQQRVWMKENKEIGYIIQGLLKGYYEMNSNNPTEEPGTETTEATE